MNEDDRDLFASDAGEGVDLANTIVEANLSVLVLSWIIALEPHLSALAALAHPALPDTHDVSPRENAHAVAAAAMSFFLFESKVARLRAMDHPWSLAPALEERVTELAVLRNALVHNHVWEVLLRRSREDWSRPGELQSAQSRHGHVLTPNYINASVDRGTKRTGILGLHLVPTEVRRWDVAQMLPVVVEALDALNEHDVRNMRSPADYDIRISGVLTPLRQAADLLV